MPFLDLPPVLLSLLLFPFGLVLGSFGNVLIHRLPREAPAERDVVNTPSHCPRCGARIRWYHNLPLLSWLWLRGRCADCSARIPFRYPLVELLAGLLLAASPWILPFGTLVWVKGVLCGLALLVLFFTDLEHFILPDVLQFPLMVLGVLFTVPQLIWPDATTRILVAGLSEVAVVDTYSNVLQAAPAWSPLGHTPVTWLDSLLGLALGYGLPWAFNGAYRLVRGRDGLGMGDFKMLAWLGAFWGWQAMLGILFVGAFLGVALGIPLALVAMAVELPRVNRTLRAFGHPTQGAYWARARRGLMTRMLPFGCALALASPLIIFYGPALWSGYLGLVG
ncbi:MAG TPA: prepilin peptidase [Holophaga sp.]|nr:prepilin peptidase [Holophaga sp.]